MRPAGRLTLSLPTAPSPSLPAFPPPCCPQLQQQKDNDALEALMGFPLFTEGDTKLGWLLNYTTVCGGALHRLPCEGRCGGMRPRQACSGRSQQQLAASDHEQCKLSH